MTARALMVLGTASHVGKSVLAAALGRILADKGYRVAPFKAQNMALNSAATPDGREIGRAQAMQAEACRIPPTADMNPILIKPSSETGAQIVVLGRVWGQVTAADYHLRRVEELFPIVKESYLRLAAEYDIVILEGAGSPAEINLREHDIVNMRMAEAADASCLLVGDIDRGGVFASLLGTLDLLEPQERARVRGFAVNKFRGDLELLRPGIRMIEERIACPCVGVVPYLRDLGMDEEDGVAVEDRRTSARAWRRQYADSPDRQLLIGVVALPHMANFTDFDPLAMEPSAAVAYLRHPEEVWDADLLILPGSKQTLGDLEWLKQTGLARAIVERHAASVGAGIVGVCGGMQMLGRTVDDPAGAENNGQPCSGQGLGLLPIVTVLTDEKITRRVAGRLLPAEIFGQAIAESSFKGYEIHMGDTVYDGPSQVFAEIRRFGEEPALRDGAVSSDAHVLGTYVHGLFDEDAFRHAFLRTARASCGLAPPREVAFFSAEREARFDRLAAHVRESLDIHQILSWLMERCSSTPFDFRAKGNS